MKKSVRRGNAGAQRKMIDEFGAEKRFGCKLFDLLRVFSVIGYRAGLRLSKAGTRKQTQRKQKTSQDPHHRPPQGKNLGGDSIAAGGRKTKNNNPRTRWGGCPARRFAWRGGGGGGGGGEGGGV